MVFSQMLIPKLNIDTRNWSKYWRNGADADINRIWLEHRRVGEMFHVNGTSKRPSNLNWFINHLEALKN